MIQSFFTKKAVPKGTAFKILLLTKFSLAINSIFSFNYCIINLMAKVVIVGYDKMLYSLIEGVQSRGDEILGVFRLDRIRNSRFKLFFKDIFNPSKDYTVIKSKKLYDIKGNSVNGDKFYQEIEKLNPDMIIVGSWSEKFKSDILNLVPCINFHPALLPKNRGANPYFWSIYLNQKVSGLKSKKGWTWSSRN